jgi:hypothetical protein
MRSALPCQRLDNRWRSSEQLCATSCGKRSLFECYCPRPFERNSTHRLNEPFLGTLPRMSPTDDPRPPVGSVRPSPAPEEMGDEENQLRIQLRERILDAVYPATRNDLLRHIGADERGPVEARLRMLPAGQSFGSVDQVLASLGGMSSPG